MPTDAELIDDINPDDPSLVDPNRIFRTARSADNFATRINTRLTRINDALQPDGPPIEPQLLANIGTELRSLQVHAQNISALTTELIEKLHIPQT